MQYIVILYEYQYFVNTLSTIMQYIVILYEMEILLTPMVLVTILSPAKFNRKAHYLFKKLRRQARRSIA